MDILVVDDDPDIRATVADILSQEGHQARAVGSAAAAVAALKAHGGRCVVLLDLAMPGGDGASVIDVIEQLNAEARRFPVIVMSATSELRGLGGKPAVIGQLLKPFDLEELVSKVRSAAHALGESRS